MDAKPPDAPRRLGAGTALQKVVEDGKQSELEAICAAIGHSSRRVSACWNGLRQSREYYDQRLVDKALWPLGKELRNLQKKTSKWCWRLPTIPI